MRDQRDEDIGSAQGGGHVHLRGIAERAGECLDVWFDDQQLSAPRGRDLLGDLKRGALAKVIDVRLEGEPENSDRRILEERLTEFAQLASLALASAASPRSTSGATKPAVPLAPASPAGRASPKSRRTGRASFSSSTTRMLLGLMSR